MATATPACWSGRARAIRLYRNGKVSSGLRAGLTLKGVIFVAAGDFDNDGLPDLCVLTESGPFLYRNLKGRSRRFQAALPPGRFERAVWLDFDHDYDLDLFLLGEKSALLRNEGEGGIPGLHGAFPFAQGHPIDAVPFRLVPDTKGIDLRGDLHGSQRGPLSRPTAGRVRSRAGGCDSRGCARRSDAGRRR